MLEQLHRIIPLVVLKLPRLARRQHRDDAIPVIGFELLGGIDEDEAERAVGIDAREEARDVQNAGCGGWSWGLVGAAFEEGFYV